MLKVASVIPSSKKTLISRQVAAGAARVVIGFTQRCFKGVFSGGGTSRHVTPIRAAEKEGNVPVRVTLIDG